MADYLCPCCEQPNPTMLFVQESPLDSLDDLCASCNVDYWKMVDAEEEVP